MDLLVNYGIRSSSGAGSGYMQLLHDSGDIFDPWTDYTIPNLNITKTDNVILQVFVPGGAETTLQLGVNNNLTLSNYYFQRVLLDGTSFNNTLGQQSYFGYSGTSPLQGSMATIRIKLANNGHVVAYS